ncbi:hypothetical protein ACLEPN_22790 [Myxococcus sp. 1LA]
MDEVLIQIRVPRTFAEAIRMRTQQTGMAVSHWVRDLIHRTLSQPELLAWIVSQDEVGKDSDWIRTLEFGDMNPHYLLVVRHFGGDLLGVEMRKGPGQGRPATEPLSLTSLRAMSHSLIRKATLYIRGSGFWSIEQIFDVANQPGLFFLKFVEAPPFAEVGAEREKRSGKRKT